MTDDNGSRWVLAFDGTCARCREISAVVQRASQDRLQVAPLSSEDVKGWREQAMGADPAWAPTLILVSGRRVRAWTGVRMGIRLVTLLGPRRSVAVLGALGELRDSTRNETQPGGHVHRRGLLRLGVGASIAAGLVLAGRSPAFAATEPQALVAARQWARANPVPRPGLYDELARIAPAHRPNIFADLTPEVRSHLWVEQVARYRRVTAVLTPEQHQVLDDFERIVADPATYVREDVAVQERMSRVELAAHDAFGKNEACRLFTRLGPPATEDSAVEPYVSCNCNRTSNCDGSNCWCTSCTSRWPGCGCGAIWTCNGHNSCA